MNDQKPNDPLSGDVHKVMFDYFKHLTMLSTGSILLLVAFLEKLFITPEWKLLIVFCFAGFVLSILASLIAMVVVGSFVRPRHKPTSIELKYWGIVAVTALSSFFIGLLCLIVFSVKNFY